MAVLILAACTWVLLAVVALCCCVVAGHSDRLEGSSPGSQDDLGKGSESLFRAA